MSKLQNVKIAVLGGGLGNERDVSLRSAENVNKILVESGLQSQVIDVDNNLITLLKENEIGLVYNMVHGTFGEDGSLSALLDFLKIPYRGPNIYQAAFCFDKLKTKDILIANNIKVPTGISFFDINNVDSLLEAITNRGFRFPLVHKLIRSGSSVGVNIVKNEESLIKLFKKTVSNNNKNDFLLEQYVYGRELTVGVYLKDGKVDILPIIELKPKNEYYDYEAKYTSGMTEMIIPAEFSKSVVYNIEEIVKSIYSIFEFNCVIRVDMILDSSNILNVLEVNTVPGMTDTSDIPMMLLNAEIEIKDFLAENLINLL